MLATLYWTWYWNPGLVTLGFFAITLPLFGLITLGVMLFDMVTRNTDLQKDLNDQV